MAGHKAGGDIFGGPRSVFGFQRDIQQMPPIDTSSGFDQHALKTRSVPESMKQGHPTLGDTM